MALIHEKLYESESLAKVNLADYIHSLLGNLLASYGLTQNNIQLLLKIEQVDMDLDTVVPCALIINELVSNSLKHAFGAIDNDQGRQNTIAIDLVRTTNNKFKLTVSDNGIGLPEGFDIDLTPSLGLRIVRILVKQLGGTITYDSGKAAAFTITFQAKK